MTPASLLSSATFADVPRLDGLLSVADAARAAASRDAGELFVRSPLAVLAPRSVDDVVTMVRYCRARRIPVVARGRGHTTFGQALGPGGLVIDMTTLDRIHAIEEDRAIVDAGVTWAEVLRAAAREGRTPPVLTGYQGLSVGGTLSVGGIGGLAYRRGAQVDHVLELEVVTGEGARVTCSPQTNPELFDAVLGGLGHCALIVRATLALVQAPSRVRHEVEVHSTVSAFLRDLRTRARARALHGLSGTIHLEAGRPARYEVNALSVAPPGSADGADWVDHHLRVDALFDSVERSGGWSGFQRPWLDVFLPDNTIEAYLEEVLPTLDPERDVGPAALGSLGQLHLFPLLTEHLKRPLLRVPAGELVFLFDILTSAHAKGSDETWAAAMLERNRRLFDRAQALGGTRYAIAAIPFTSTEWAEQFGNRVQKRLHDPDGILGYRPSNWIG